MNNVKIKVENLSLYYGCLLYTSFGVAIDAIVPVVHPDNSANNLTLQQLRDIYNGKDVYKRQVAWK